MPLPTNTNKGVDHQSLWLSLAFKHTNA